MTYGSWISAALVTLVAGVVVAGCGSDDGKTLTVYSGRGEELVAPLLERYEKQSGVELKVRYGDSAELAATILEEGDRSPADVFLSQDAGALGALEKDGRLAELGPDVLAKVDSRFRSEAGMWIGTAGRARVVAYDGRELEESDLPASILGFTDPKWKGRIGWAPTNASFQAFVTALRVTKGEEAAGRWLEGLVKNKPKRFENNALIRDAIAAGEVDVGFINHYYVAQARAEEGSDYPVRIYQPPGGDPGSLVNVAGVGILESSRDREAAVDLVEFLLSRGGQEYFSGKTKEYPLVDGVEADSSLVPLRQIQQPDIDLSDLDDLEGTLDLIERSGAL